MQFLAKLAGHNFRPASAKAALAVATKQQPLRLQREPDNQYDPNAIQVIDIESGEFIGFIDKGIAADLALYLDGITTADHTRAEVLRCEIYDFVSGPKAPTILIEVTTGYEVDTQVGDDDIADQDYGLDEDEDDEDGED